MPGNAFIQFNTYEGTYDMHTLIVGRDVTGLDAVR